MPITDAEVTTRYADMLAALGSEGTAAHRPPSAFGAPGRPRRRRDRLRAGHPALDALASPRQAEERRPHRRAPREHVPSLHRRHRDASGNRRVPVRRVLHPQQGDQARSHHLRLPMRRRHARDRYPRSRARALRQIARNVQATGSSCCYDGESGSEGISANLYAADETKCLPQDALTASLGCGNPTALAELQGRRDRS